MNYKLYRTSIFATIIGNCMEWFDYALIGYIAPRYLDLYPLEKASINPLFFIYGAALVGRPIGGIVFGYLGDTLGRRLILMLSITLMATGALFTVILPSLFYFSLLTPMLLLLLLLTHNLSAGGETPATVIYLYETFPQRLRPFALTFVYLGFFLGVFLSTADFSSLYWELTEEQFLNWGWRIPFLFSATLGFLGLMFRKKLHESPQFHHIKSDHEKSPNPISMLFKNYKKEFFLGIGMLFLHSIAINTLVIFGPSYFQTYLNRTPDETLTLSVFSMTIAMLTSSFVGYLSLKISAFKILKFIAAILVIAVLPLYTLMQAKSIVPLFIANGILAMLISGFSSLVPSFVCGLFPASIRCTGYSFCVNVPIPLIDGLIPIALSYLISTKNLMLSPAYLIIIGAIISISCMLYVQTHHRKTLSEASC